MQGRVRSEARAARMRARWADPAYAAKMREAARRGAAIANARRRSPVRATTLGPVPAAPVAGSLAKMERALVARLGTVVFAVCLGLPAIVSTSTARASVVVASVEGASVAARVSSFDIEPADLIALPLPADGDVAAAEASVAAVEPEPAPEPEPAVAPPPPPPVVAGVVAPPAPSWPPPEPLVLDGIVVASWYGPGFYGNTTACGQEYTPEILGVAHRTLPCGTPIRITSPAGRTVVVPVIDRGPFIAGRSLDLSNATRAALSCSDLCHVRMTVGH